MPNSGRKGKTRDRGTSGAGQVEVLVDNEIAVQNLTKMAEQKGYQSSAKKLADQEYQVIFTVGEQTEEEKAQAGAEGEAVFRTAYRYRGCDCQ